MNATTANAELVICRDRTALAAEAARRIVAAASDALSRRGQFTLVLSGGSTPERAYALLAGPRDRAQIDWSRTWLLFGDERYVGHDDQRSNYHMARAALIEPAAVGADRVLAIPTDRGSAAACAAAYEERLRRQFELPAPASFPQFDLILLGLGGDGHTASLFPGMPALEEARAWAVGTPPGVLPPPVDRITLTFPVLNAARQILFLVAGEEKATIVRNVLEGPPDVRRFPATGIQPTTGRLTWLLDAPAASSLSQKQVNLLTPDS